MRDDYRGWLEAEGYADNTCNAQMARVQRIEETYGALDDIVAQGGYDQLFAELSYSTSDERHGRPNPSRFVINGNLRNNLASYKDALARYRRFLASGAGQSWGHSSGQTLGMRGTMPAARVFTDAPEPMLPDAPTLEKQRLSLERDMQVALREDIARLEPGLVIIDDGAERAVLSGFIDILARDASGAVVVIELKAGRTDARVIGQTLGYMGDIAAEDDAVQVRGIIVAHGFDQRTLSAARAVSQLSLVRYAVSFTFAAEE